MADPLAVYGAVIGTAAAVGALWNIYSGAIRDRPRLMARLAREWGLGEGAIVSDEPDGWARLDQYYGVKQHNAVVEVRNTGRRPITAAEAGLEFADQYRVVFSPGSTVRLAEGETGVFRLPEPSLAEALRQMGMPLYIHVRDGSGGVHRRSINRALQPWLEKLARSGERDPEGSGTADGAEAPSLRPKR